MNITHQEGYRKLKIIASVSDDYFYHLGKRKMTHRQAKPPCFIKQSPLDYRNLDYRNNRRDSSTLHLIDVNQDETLTGMHHVR